MAFWSLRPALSRSALPGVRAGARYPLLARGPEAAAEGVRERRGQLLLQLLARLVPPALESGAGESKTPKTRTRNRAMIGLHMSKNAQHRIFNF